MSTRNNETLDKLRITQCYAHVILTIGGAAIENIKGTHVSKCLTVSCLTQQIRLNGIICFHLLVRHPYERENMTHLMREMLFHCLTLFQATRRHFRMTPRIKSANIPGVHCVSDRFTRVTLFMLAQAKVQLSIEVLNRGTATKRLWREFANCSSKESLRLLARRY